MSDKMTDEKYKTIIAVTGLICLTGLQLYAWYTGHNGVVFATTSAIFGGIIGGYFNIKKSIGEYVNENRGK